MTIPELTILGAGVAGLAASSAAMERGFNAVIYEAADRAGGLLDALEVEGYRFDKAVHLSFADNPEARQVFDKTPYGTFHPIPRCVDYPHWLKHPVQNNLYPLPVEERVALIQGFIDRPETEVRTYSDWLAGQYGSPLAERYPERYTRKYWTIPAEQMGIDWIGPRIHRPALAEVLRGSMTESTENVYYAPEMRYPLRGGFRAFIDPLVAHADVRLNHRVSRVEPIVKQLHFSNGNIVRYNRLISTIPLPALVELIDDAPPEILRASRALVATSIDLISIGIRKPNTFSDVWFYIYDDDVAAARANCPSVQSPDNCPPGCSSIQFEIYSSARRPNPLDIQRMRENCISALQKWGFACPDDIAVTHHHHVRYGNVVFEQGMEKNRDIVRKWLLESGITGAGRFGEWDYLWSHQAFMSGAAAAHRLL